ncbi:MAG: hypothetical protein L6R45_25570 [Anaerolineae bacterium]|nr:hypothetical protein [Anaerolineae bacterium]
MNIYHEAAKQGIGVESMEVEVTGELKLYRYERLGVSPATVYCSPVIGKLLLVYLLPYQR